MIRANLVDGFVSAFRRPAGITRFLRRTCGPANVVHLMSCFPQPTVSVLAPCYDEEDVLPEFLRRVGAVLDDLGSSTEIVLVDDGSRDRTWEIMNKAAAEDSRITAVRLMRNHGHQLALTAGLTFCRGERI